MDADDDLANGPTATGDGEETMIYGGIAPFPPGRPKDNQAASKWFVWLSGACLITKRANVPGRRLLSSGLAVQMGQPQITQVLQAPGRQPPRERGGRPSAAAAAAADDGSITWPLNPRGNCNFWPRAGQSRVLI